jgi:translation initiation factor RLI1
MSNKEHKPLEAEIEVIDDPSTYTGIEARHATADAIRYLLEEIQKLKAEK